MHGGWVRSTAVFVALMLCAACGSTVQQRGSGANGRDEAVETAGGELGLDGSSDAAGGDSTTAGSGTSGGSSGTIRRTSGTAGPGGGGGSASTAVGPGVTADKIHLGLAYAVNSSAANSALGAAGITQGDTKRTNQIVIDDINAHGGIAGRQVVPVWHELDGASTATYDTLEQQTCDTWTQDNKVFAAFSGGGQTMLQCLHNRGVIGIQDDLTSADAALFRKYPYYVEIGTLNLDRAAAAEVAALKAQGWFGGWNHATGTAGSTKAKVGIVTYDGPSWDHAVDQSLVPALREAGYAPAAEDIIRVQPPGQTSDTGPIGAAVSSAVLKLRTDQVSHVIVFDERGLLTLFFMQNSDSQGYRPRYGLTSQNGPQALMDGASLPARQLIGSKGIGWVPSLDLRPADNTRNGPFTNDQRRKCLALLESKGVTFADPNAETIAMTICTQWWFFREVVKASGNLLSRVGFMDGVAKLGTSFVSAGSFANRFTATQHDGVAAVRHYEFNSGCTCMRYTSNNVGV